MDYAIVRAIRLQETTQPGQANERTVVSYPTHRDDVNPIHALTLLCAGAKLQKNIHGNGRPQVILNEAVAVLGSRG